MGNKTYPLVFPDRTHAATAPSDEAYSAAWELLGTKIKEVLNRKLPKDGIHAHWIVTGYNPHISLVKEDKNGLGDWVVTDRLLISPATAYRLLIASGVNLEIPCEWYVEFEPRYF